MDPVKRVVAVGPEGDPGGDTIVAVASAQGRAERSVIRVSGPRAGALVHSTCGRHSPPRGAHDVHFHDGVGAVPCLLLWMPGPRSFTAEDVAELHLPGHPGLVQAALVALLGAGARMAEPGEFTRRAFENGRIDLTRAEGVAALVSARSEGERRAATALLVGGLAKRIETIRDGLEDVRSLSEASLDFDEADTGHVPTSAILELVEALSARVQEALGWERQRTASDRSCRIALVGEPNAGKSTLFNRLVGEAAARLSGPAIVSDLEGTTRDAKHGPWELPGEVVADLFDTAGRSADQPSPGHTQEPDRLAEQRARELMDSADLVLWVVDGATISGSPPEPPPGLDPVERAEDRARTILVVSKCDVASVGYQALGGYGVPVARVSAATGSGIEGLEELAGAALGLGAEERGGAAVWALGARHVAALQEAALGLAAAAAGADVGLPLDLIAEELKRATDALDEITGQTVPEDLLSRIFARFCLGK